MIRTVALLVAGGLFLVLLVLGPQLSYGMFGPLSPPPASKVVVGQWATFQCSPLDAFEGWLGVTPGSTYSLISSPGGNFPSASNGVPSLSQIEAALQANQCTYGVNRPQEVSVQIQDTPTAILDGTYDTYLTNLGIALAAEAPNAVVRWDWEFNGKWTYFYPGSTTLGIPGNNGYTPANFVSVWQYAIPKIRANAPGIKVEWTPNQCNPCNQGDPLDSYPGNNYVDYIGLDIYDNNQSSSDAQSTWTNAWVGTTSGRTLAWQVALAKANGKGMSIGEWGVGSNQGFPCTTSPPSSAADPIGAYLISQMALWLNNTDNVNGYEPYVYFDYWNSNQGGVCDIVDGSGAAGSISPYVAARPPPSSDPSNYQLPLSAQAFYTAFHGWQ
jgi:hypothetical protein